MGKLALGLVLSLGLWGQSTSLLTVTPSTTAGHPTAPGQICFQDLQVPPSRHKVCLQTVNNLGTDQIVNLPLALNAPGDDQEVLFNQNGSVAASPLLKFAYSGSDLVLSGPPGSGVIAPAFNSTVAGSYVAFQTDNGTSVGLGNGNWAMQGANILGFHTSPGTSTSTGGYQVISPVSYDPGGTPCYDIYGNTVTMPVPVDGQPSFGPSDTIIWSTPSPLMPPSCGTPPAIQNFDGLNFSTYISSESIATWNTSFASHSVYGNGKNGGGMQGGAWYSGTLYPYNTVTTSIQTATKHSGGSGYLALDTVTVDGGSTPATITIDTVSGGSVSTFHLTNAGGDGYSTATNVTTTHVLGSGAGFTVDISTHLAFAQYLGGATYVGHSCGPPTVGAWSGVLGFSITSAVRTDNVVTVTTSSAHGLAYRDTVIIAGLTPPTLDGAYFVWTTPTANTFTYVIRGANLTSTGGTVQKWIPSTIQQHTNPMPDFLGLQQGLTYYDDCLHTLRYLKDDLVTWVNVGSGGGSGTPGGPTSAVQINDPAGSSTFTGYAGLVYDPVNSILKLGNLVNNTSGISSPIFSGLQTGRASSDLTFQNANANFGVRVDGGILGQWEALGGPATAAGYVKLMGGTSGYSSLQAATGAITSYTWTLPTADASGCISSNGAGVLGISPCSGSPGGLNTQLQVNVSGTFGAFSTLTYASPVLTVSGASAGITVGDTTNPGVFNASVGTGCTTMHTFQNSDSSAFIDCSGNINGQQGNFGSNVAINPTAGAAALQYSVVNALNTGTAQMLMVNNLGHSAVFKMHGSAFAGYAPFANQAAFGSTTGIFIYTDAGVSSGGTDPIVLSPGGYANTAVIISPSFLTLQPGIGLVIDTSYNINSLGVGNLHGLSVDGTTFSAIQAPSGGFYGQETTMDSYGSYKALAASPTFSNTAYGDLWAKNDGTLHYASYDGAAWHDIALGSGGGGTIGGSIASGQIAFGSGTNTIAGSANLTYASNMLTSAGSGSGFLAGDSSFPGIFNASIGSGCTTAHSFQLSNSAWSVDCSGHEAGQTLALAYGITTGVVSGPSTLGGGGDFSGNWTVGANAGNNFAMCGATSDSSAFCTSSTPGNFYNRVYKGGDASCSGVSDGWTAIRADTLTNLNFQICIGGTLHKLVIP